MTIDLIYLYSLIRARHLHIHISVSPSSHGTCSYLCLFFCRCIPLELALVNSSVERKYLLNNLSTHSSRYYLCQFILLGMQTTILLSILPYTECVALICQGEWVSPLTLPFIGLCGGWGLHSVNSAKTLWIQKKTIEKNPKLKCLHAESDFDNDSDQTLFPKFIVLESKEDTPNTKLSPFIIEKPLAVL